jgi:hypothetical protein
VFCRPRGRCGEILAGTPIPVGPTGGDSCHGNDFR